MAKYEPVVVVRECVKFGAFLADQLDYLAADAVGVSAYKLYRRVRNGQMNALDAQRMYQEASGKLKDAYTDDFDDEEESDDR